MNQDDLKKIASIRPNLNTPHELINDVLGMLPELDAMLVVVSFKDGSCRAAFTNMPMPDCLFLQKVLELEINKRIETAFIPDNPNAS